MIFELILTPVIALLNLIVSGLPELRFPINIVQGLTEILNLWNDINCFIPINFALLLFGTYWVIVNGKLFISIATWIYDKIPFI